MAPDQNSSYGAQLSPADHFLKSNILSRRRLVHPRADSCQTLPNANIEVSSSNKSHETGQSDPQEWFDHANQNSVAAIDNNTMDSMNYLY